MPAVTYVSSAPWWSAAKLNELCGEFDRRLTKALAGKTPYLLGRYGIGYEPDNVLTRKFTLPIAQTTSDAIVKGIGFPSGTMGAVYCFKGEAADVVYFERTTAFDQAAMDTSAAAASEVSRDATAKTMVVNDTGAAISLEWSLKALTRTDSGTKFWLVPQTTGSKRAMRKHRYAVAEIVLEGLSTFTIPRTWDRFSCFRIHNLSAISVTVTVETYAADGTNGADETITLDKFGCRSFRREAGYYNADWNYCWKVRAGKDKRFYQPTGSLVVEASAHANNFANPNIIKDWLDALGALRDPYVDPPNEYPRYAGLFGDPSNTATKIHDLIAHDGACKSIGWDASNNPIETVGTVGNSSSIVSNLAALGITVSVVGSTYKLERNDATAEGEDSKGLDLFCNGSNLLWQEANTVTVPGNAPFAQPDRQRQYQTLPATLMEDVPVSSLVNPVYTGFSSTGYFSGTVTRTLYGGTSTSSSVTIQGGTRYGGTGYTVTRLSTLGSAFTSIDGPNSSIGTCILTPFGFAVPWEYTYTFPNTLTTTSTGEPLNGGIYQRWSGTTVTRKSWVHIEGPGWSFGSLKPLRNRVFGLSVHDAGGWWETEDWSGERSDPDGNEPTATGKILLEYPELKYLSDGTPSVQGDVYDIPGASPANRTETRYSVMVDSDEARSVVDGIVAARRVQFNQGTTTLAGGTYPSTYYHRRPMQIEDFNTLAWMVNAWTRTKPLVTIKNLWLKRTNSGSYPGLYIPEFSWPYDAFPKNAAFYFVPGSPATAWTKANWSVFVTLLDRQDMPNWTAAHDNHLLYYTTNATERRYRYNRTIGALIPGVGYPVAYDTDWTVTVASSTAVRDSGWTGCEWDHDGADAGFAWVSVEEVSTLAASKGLPYTHCVWGEGLKLIAHAAMGPTDAPFDGSPFAHIDQWPYPTWDGTPATMPPATINETLSISPTTIPGFAVYVPADDAGDVDYIYGGVFQSDSNGEPLPLNGRASWHRGVPAITGNSYSWAGHFGIDPTVDPVYTDAECISFSENRSTVAAMLKMEGYTDGQLNSRWLIGGAYTRTLSSVNVPGLYGAANATRTGGAWVYTSTMSATELTAGLNYFCPDSGVAERTVKMVSDPYVDLEA